MERQIAFWVAVVGSIWTALMIGKAIIDSYRTPKKGASV